MIKEQFAPDYSRDSSDRVIFPRDSDLRALLFPFTDPSEHIAKANMYMVRELVQYVSEEGETILDPFGGTGTILVALTIGRKVMMIEIEERFQTLIERNIQGISRTVPNAEELVTLIPDNNNRVLPLSPGLFNHIITSPPYATALKKKTMDKFSLETGYASALQYSSHPENVSNLSDFMYEQRMETFYKKCYSSLPIGGTITIIIKDRVEDGKRIQLGKRAQRDCINAGFEPVSWFQWFCPGGAFMAIRKHRGEMTIDEEDLITLRRP